MKLTHRSVISHTVVLLPFGHPCSALLGTDFHDRFKNWSANHFIGWMFLLSQFCFRTVNYMRLNLSWFWIPECMRYHIDPLFFWPKGQISADIAIVLFCRGIHEQIQSLSLSYDREHSCKLLQHMHLPRPLICWDNGNVTGRDTWSYCYLAPPVLPSSCFQMPSFLSKPFFLPLPWQWHRCPGKNMAWKIPQIKYGQILAYLL